MARYPLLEGLEVILITDSTNKIDSKTYDLYKAKLLEEFGCAHVYELDICTQQDDIKSVEQFIACYNKVALCVTVFPPGAADLTAKLVNEFQFYKIATIDLMIPIVSHQWIEDVLFHGKILKTSRNAINPEYFLQNCNIYINKNEYSEVELHVLQIIISNFGGSVILSTYRSTLVTHILTSNEHLYKSKLERTLIARPEWIIFMLLKYRRVEIADSFESDSSLAEFPKVFQGQVFFISDAFRNAFSSIGIENFTSILDTLITKRGGTVHYSSPSSSIYRNAYSFEYKHDAAFDCLPMSNRCNLWWLLDSINYKLGSNKMNKKLLHYPYKALDHLIPQAKSQLLSFTNFIGVQRFYVQELLSCLEIPYTLDFSAKNTSLIYYYKNGPKYKYAKAQNIPTLNHNYLEYCYKFGKIIDYNTFMNNFDNDFKFVNYCGLVGSSFEKDTGKGKTADEEDYTNKQGIGNSEYDGREDSFVDTHVANKQPSSSEKFTQSVINEVLDMASPNVPITEELNNATFAKPLKEIHDVEIVSTKNELMVTTPNKGQNQEANTEKKVEEQNIEAENYDKSVVSNVSPVTKLSSSASIEKNSSRVGDVEKENEQFTKKIHESTQVNSFPSKSTSPSVFVEFDQTNSSVVSQNFANNSLTSSQITHSQRKAKQKAVKKVTKDIGTLNEYQKVAKKKRLDDEGNYTNTSFEVTHNTSFSHKKTSENNFADGDGSVLDDSDEDLSSELRNNLKQLLFEDNNKFRTLLPTGETLICITTGFQMLDYLDRNNLEQDLKLLRAIGVQLVNAPAGEMNSKETDLYNSANCLIAPKKLRTEKFLKALSLRNLRYIILPKFLTQVLTVIKEGNSRHLPSISKYKIPEMDCDNLQKQIQFLVSQNEHISSVSKSHSTNMFSTYGINKINIVQNINGGVPVISDILRAHGIVDVNSISEKVKDIVVDRDVVANEKKRDEKKFSDAPYFKYVFLVNKTSQANSILKALKQQGIISSEKKTKKDGATSEQVLIVEWNWCVKCIFNLSIDFNNKEFVVYMQ